MSDSQLDGLSPSAAIAYAAGAGITIYSADDTAAYELCGVLPSRAIAARVLAYALTSSTTGAERGALTRVATSRNDAELAQARENARLVKLALLAA